MQARARRGTSPEVTVELREEAESAPLTLVVSERTKLKGQVLGPSGPVPGAQVMAAPAHEPLSAAPLLRTDATGSFSLEVALETREVVARIGAPGFAYAVRRAPVVPGQPLRLTVEQAGGTLVLDLGDLADPATWRSEVPLLVKDGVAVAPTELTLWARANGESQQGRRLAVPMMEPGSYALCRVPMASAADVFAGRWPLDRCTAGSLSPFGQLRLELGPS